MCAVIYVILLYSRHGKWLITDCAKKQPRRNYLNFKFFLYISFHILFFLFLIFVYEENSVWRFISFKCIHHMDAHSFHQNKKYIAMEKYGGLFAHLNLFFLLCCAFIKISSFIFVFIRWWKINVNHLPFPVLKDETEVLELLVPSRNITKKR